MWPAVVLLSLASSASLAPLQTEANGTVTVKTVDGLLRGEVVTSVWNRTYLSFKGVPYAQPPVGELRFKSPKPVKRWTGVRDAIDPAPYCIQQLSDNTVNASEDCLYLNIYVPQAAASSRPAKGLTVLVWIHGGAYVYRSGIKDQPGNLMNHSIIVVSINYRLGSLGFLSLEHPEVTSNAALKDQVAALRWVKRNIAQFGGNPDDVTVFGGLSILDLTSFPVVDAKIQEGKEVFLTDTPEKLLRAGKAHPIPYIIGFNSQEAKWFVAGDSDATLHSYNNNSELFVPASLNIKKGSAESVQVGEKIRSFFFGNKSVSYDTITQLTEVMSDNFMIYSVYRSAMLHVKYGSSPIYMYVFTHDGKLESHTGNTTAKGPGHGEDINYLFSNTLPYNPDSDDLKVVKHFTGMWVDFAKSGNPSLHESVKWIPATKTNHTYLQLDVELSLHQNPLQERMTFWDELYETYGK